MTITISTITALPAAPSRTAPTTFAALADAFIAALPDLVTDINTATGEIKSQVEAEVATVTARLGEWALIKTITTSGSQATVDFINGVSSVVMDSTYDAYMLELIGVGGTTDGAQLMLRTTTNASTFDSSGYAYSHHTFHDATYTTSASAAQVALTGNVGNASGEVGAHGSIEFFKPSTAAPLHVHWKLSAITDGGALVGYGGVGMNSAIANVDGVRLLFSAGNFTNGGIVNLHGRRK